MSACSRGSAAGTVLVGGAGTLVECTPAWLGRDPALLKRLSEASGLHIVTNTGYYGAAQDKFVPAHAFAESAERLAERWTAEWRDGIEDTGIRVMAPLNIAWGEAQFPHKVSATGGIYAFDDGREVPDTFSLLADYPKGHSLVLSSSMANDTHIPGLICGHEGTIMMVPEGRFEGRVDYITITPQAIARPRFKERYGTIEVKLETEPRESHMENFLRCLRTRETPVLDAATAYRAMVTIGMSVQSYREGRVLYFDAQREKVVTEPPRA